MFANIDPNWVLAGLTAIYVVATIAICWANWAAASAAKKQTEEMRKQYKDSNRPRLAIRFDARSLKDRSIVVKNYGNKPAMDVKVSLNEDFMKCLIKAFPQSPLQSLIHSDIYIGENQEFWLFLADWRLLNQVPVKAVCVTVSYKSNSGDVYEETASIDLGQYNFMSWVNPKENTIWINGRWLAME